MTSAAMLSHADGYGQCTAWSDLFATTLRAQGIAGAREQDIFPEAGFIKFRVNLTTGQGHGTPNTEFGFHRVVRISGEADVIYDPSYGAKVVKDDWRPVQIKYEDLYVSHLLTSSWNWVANPASDPSHPTDPEQRQLWWSDWF